MKFKVGDVVRVKNGYLVNGLIHEIKIDDFRPYKIIWSHTREPFKGSAQEQILEFEQPYINEQKMKQLLGLTE